MKVPGTIGYPIIGDKSREFLSDPTKFITSRINEHSSRIFQCRILNNPTIFVCSPQAVKTLLSEEMANDIEHGYKSILHRLYGDNIVFENDVTANELHNCLKNCFQNMELYKETVNRLCEPLLSSLHLRTEPVYIYPEFKRVMTRMCLELFLGIKTESCLDQTEEITHLATQHWHGIISVPVSLKIPLAGESTYSLAVQAKEKLLSIIRSILLGQNGQGDASVAAKLRHADFSNSKSLEQHLLLFVSAVIPKAFASLITSFIIVMAGDDKEALRARARTDSKFLDRVLLEVERMWPPLFAGRRLVRRTTTLESYDLPKDYAIMYVTHAAHRDPEVFPEPNSFNPDRWITCNAGQEDLVLCFGSGPRCCVGTDLIRRILRDVASRLLQNYEWSLAPPNQDTSYKYLPVARPAVQPSIAFSSYLTNDEPFFDACG
uniref:Beta-amyrin 11-oxidase n=1 Tax=Ciona intestinalis TaxID=7719 RepID=F6VF53_CIOIN|nr:beta-amyrin 11-oxidase [Ciona intestinalis]|eukprot:XP_002130785.1 beta-amyrin 11-oxidase [Ciona intestinalis]